MLRPPRPIWILTSAALVVAVAFTTVLFVFRVEIWLRVFFVAFCGLLVVALAELAQTRLVLGEAILTCVSLFRRRDIPREEIESVTWEKGGGVSLKLANGQWFRLPGVGKTLQGTTNTVRAWLRRTADTAGTTRDGQGPTA